MRKGGGFALRCVAGDSLAMLEGCGVACGGVETNLSLVLRHVGGSLGVLEVSL